MAVIRIGAARFPIGVLVSILSIAGFGRLYRYRENGYGFPAMVGISSDPRS